VLCVDYATEVYQEVERRRSLAAPTVMRSDRDGGWDAAGGDPDLVQIVGDSDVGL
jgi:hypothetical protein